MRIEIYGNTNKNYCMVNTAKFHLKNGGIITVDREETEYTVNTEINQLSMLWKGVYLWAVNDCYLFDGEDRVYPNAEEFIELISGATLELELEDDADEDYVVTDITWCAYEDEFEASGKEYKPDAAKHIVDGLQFTVEMFLFNPETGETYEAPRNDQDATTINACRDAITYIKEREDI